MGTRLCTYASHMPLTLLSSSTTTGGSGEQSKRLIDQESCERKRCASEKHGHGKICRFAVCDIGNGAHGKNLLVWSDESNKSNPYHLVGPHQQNPQETAQPTKFGRLDKTGHGKICRFAVCTSFRLCFFPDCIVPGSEESARAMPRERTNGGGVGMVALVRDLPEAEASLRTESIAEGYAQKRKEGTETKGLYRWLSHLRMLLMYLASVGGTCTMWLTGLATWQNVTCFRLQEGA
jgi:hypothetical protein